MALSDADAATLATLEGARMKIITGSKVERVVYDGREVNYGAGDLQRLEADIATLRGKSCTRNRSRGAIRFRV